jgi:hypothetical protein
MRLTRKQVKEALEQTPIEQVLLGSVGARETKLTPKQREFARQLAMGESKAGAYRKSRESKAKPSTASRKGVALASQDHIRAQVEAFRAAFEAQKYQTPAHLRALAIHELTKHALDEDCPPAQRIKALELIGKMTEVALFTERREIVQVTDAAQAKERLLDALRTITQAEVVDVVDTAAESLLAELAGPSIEAQDTEALAEDPQADHPETILNSTPGAIPHPPAA